VQTSTFQFLRTLTAAASMGLLSLALGAALADKLTAPEYVAVCARVCEVEYTSCKAGPNAGK